jgi:hypothetical protein
MCLLENRSTVSIFIVHSGIPKAYNRWYRQYINTCVRCRWFSHYISTCVKVMCLLVNRSTVSIFLLHSGIPKGYNRLYIQYISTSVRGMCLWHLYLYLTVPSILSLWDPRMHYKYWYIWSVLQKAWWWLSRVKTCCLTCNCIIKFVVFD